MLITVPHIILFFVTIFVILSVNLFGSSGKFLHDVDNRYDD